MSLNHINFQTCWSKSKTSLAETIVKFDYQIQFLLESVPFPSEGGGSIPILDMITLGFESYGLDLFCKYC